MYSSAVTPRYANVRPLAQVIVPVPGEAVNTCTGIESITTFNNFDEGVGIWKGCDAVDGDAVLAAGRAFRGLGRLIPGSGLVAPCECTIRIFFPPRLRTLMGDSCGLSGDTFPCDVGAVSGEDMDSDDAGRVSSVLDPCRLVSGRFCEDNERIRFCARLFP